MAIAKDFVFFGRVSLDFAHSGDMGYGERFERLVSPSELNRWLRLSRLQLPRMRITEQDLEQAKALRGAIWRVSEALLENVPPARKDVSLLNRYAAVPCLVRELDPTAQSMRWRHPTIAAALAAIAQDAVQLFGDPSQRDRLHRCENSGCRAIFYDDSRPGLRRWCASNRCGDRVRSKLYRERKKSTGNHA